MEIIDTTRGCLVVLNITHYIHVALYTTTFFCLPNVTFSVVCYKPAKHLNPNHIKSFQTVFH